MPSDAFFKLEEEKKNKLLESAMKEFSALPYEKVSVFKIAQKAGISRSVFYYYFKDKRDIYNYLIAQLKMEIVQMLDHNGGVQYDIFTFTQKLFHQAAQQKGTDREAFVRQVIANMKTEDTGYFFDLIDTCQVEQHFRYLCNLEDLNISTDQQLKGLTCLLVASTLQILLMYFVSDESLSDAEAQLDQIFEMIKYGVLKQNKREEQEERC